MLRINNIVGSKIGKIKTKKLWIGIAIVVIVALAIAITITQTKEEPKEIKIGVVLPLTGGRANAGEDAKAGMELAVNSINSNGGINGKKLELIYEDNGNSAQITVSAVTKLINVDKLPVIVGPLSSTATLSAAPVAEKSKTVLFSPTASSPDISRAGDYIFRNGVLAEQQTKKLAEYCISILKAREIAVLHINDDTGKGYRETFSKFFENLGGEVIFTDKFEKDEKDYKTQITKLKNSNVRFVFVPSTPQSLGFIIKQSVELGFKPTFIANFGIEGDELLKIAGEHADGIYYASIPITSEFSDKLKNTYNKKASVVAALGYDSILIIAETIRRGGYNSEGIKAALYQLEFKGVTGMVSFDKNGDAQKEIIMKTVKNGQFTEAPKQI